MPIYINTYTNQSTADEPKPEQRAATETEREREGKMNEQIVTLQVKLEFMLFRTGQMRINVDFA